MKRSKDELPGGEPRGLIRVREALDDLGSHWIYGQELCDAYHISVATLGRYKKYFPDHVFRYKTRDVWSGDVNTIASLKERLNA